MVILWVFVLLINLLPDRVVIINFDSRRWVQAVFCLSDGTNSSNNSEAAIRIDHPGQDKMELNVNENILKKPVKDLEVDMSDGVAAEMFGLPTSSDHDNEVEFFLSFTDMVILKTACVFRIFLSFYILSPLR